MEGISNNLHDLAPYSLLIIMLMLHRFCQEECQRKNKKIECKMHIKWKNKTDNREKSSKKTRRCFCNTRNRLKISLNFLVIGRLSFIEQCIIYHRRIRTGDKTRTKSENEFSNKKSPESSSKCIPSKPNHTKEHSNYEWFSASKYIRKISCRNLKKYNRNSEACLNSKYVFIRESMLTIKYRDNRHHHEKPSDCTQNKEDDDIARKNHTFSIFEK